MHPEKRKHRFLSMTVHFPLLEYAGMIVQKKVKFPANAQRILSVRAVVDLGENRKEVAAALKLAIDNQKVLLAKAVIIALEKADIQAQREQLVAQTADEPANDESVNDESAQEALKIANEAYLVADAADTMAIEAIKTGDIALKVASAAKYGYAVAITGKFLTHRSLFFHTAVQRRAIEIMNPYLDCSALWTRLDFDIPTNKNANLIAEGIGEIGKTLNSHRVKVVFLLEING